jgi:hypothetical protein
MRRLYCMRVDWMSIVDLMRMDWMGMLAWTKMDWVSMLSWIRRIVKGWNRP